MKEKEICIKCANYRSPSLKFKVRVNSKGEYTDKEFTFPFRCLYGLKESVLNALIQECSEFKMRGL